MTIPRSVYAAVEDIRKLHAGGGYSYREDMGDETITSAEGAITVLLAALAQVEQGWQPIDTAPQGVWVLAHWSQETIKQTDVIIQAADGRWLDVEPASWDNEDGEFYKPTHWMPLPASPALQAAKEER